LIEAAACGLPLVTTDVPGCRDVVRDGIEGLLVPARDATALASAIEKLIDDFEYAADLGRAARERAKREFTEAEVNARTKRVYDEVLSSTSTVASARG
jgi:glycosyltransferase involved in cell wall biosynthesis